jgi:hypothetical protein
VTLPITRVPVPATNSVDLLLLGEMVMVVDVLVFLGHGLAQVVPLCPLCHHPQPSGGCCGGEARRRNAGAIPGLAAAATAWALPQHAVASAPRRM